MTDYGRDIHAGAYLIRIRAGRVSRAPDGREIGTVVGGNVYDFGGRFLCGLASLEDRSGAEIPETLKLLLEW
jgi:hypothetical protein